jgi:phage-related protein
LGLPAEYRKAIGDDIRTVQFGWPVGIPLVEKLEANLWEVRIKLADGIARALFAIHDDEAILLHGFVKTRTIPL